MRKMFWSALSALAVAGGIGTSAQAENYDSMTAELHELHELRSRVAALEHVGGGVDGGCCDVGCNPCCDPCNRSSGVVGGAEFVYLKWHSNTVADGVGSTDYEESWRVWAGWQDCDGLGVRMRYWEFDHDNARDVFIDDVDTYTWDLEVFDSSILGCYWDATWFAGVRYMEFTNTVGVAETAGFFGDAFNYRGIGLTMGGEIRRAVTDRIGIFANSRVSLLYGRERYFDINAGVAEFEAEYPDATRMIYEMQMGVEGKRCLSTGGYAFARAFAEAQYWTEMSGGALDAGFIGFGASVGIYR